MLRNLFRTIKSLVIKLNSDEINTYSAQASFFIVLSLFPFTMLLLMLIKYTPLTESFLLSQTLEIMPDAIDSFVVNIIVELYDKASSAVISFSAIVAIWSASKGVLSIVRGLNAILDIEDKRNYFILRFKAAIYTSIFLIAILLSMILLVFGHRIYNYLEDASSFLYSILGFFVRQRLLISVFALTLLFMVIYKALPAKKHCYADVFPGSLFSALGWIISSFGLSIYFNNFPNFSYTYGSLASFILLMLWIYIGMYILFIGAEINIFFKTDFQKLISLIKGKN